MSEIKKAFEKLDTQMLSDNKKQEIFDRIIDKRRQQRSLRKKIFTVAVPLFAAFVIAFAAFVMPGLLAPGKDASQMMILDKPQDEKFTDAVLTADAPKVVSTVILSINPVVQFDLDENGSVLEMKGLDEDGQKLLADIDFEGLTFENASIVVVNQLLLNDYIRSGEMDAQITVSIDSDQAGMDTLEVLTNTIKTAAVKHNIDVSVTQSEDTQQLSLVLTGEAESFIDSKQSGLITVTYLADTDNRGNVLSVSAKGADGTEFLTSVDFAGMTFREAVLYSINSLIRQGIISDESESEILFNIGTTDENVSAGFKFLTQLLLTQAGLSLDVLGTDEAGVFGLASSERTPDEKAKISMSQILDPTLHKSRNDLTKTQMDILEFVYTQEQIEELLAIRYWVVVPNLLGLSEQKAIEMLEQMGIVPVVTREYNEDYAQFEEGTVFYQDSSAGAIVEKGDRFAVFVLDRNPSPLGEGWAPSVNKLIDTGTLAAIHTQYETYDSATAELYVRITNLSEGEVLLYDTDFTLERLFDGEWYSAVCTECHEPAARMLEPLVTTGEKINMKFAGELEDGHYRIVKQLGNSKYSAEFDVAAGGYNSVMLSGYIPLEELPAVYTAETAVQDKDFVVDNAGSVFNDSRLTEFLQCVQEKIPCKLRRTMFTVEGDAIVDDIVFTGKYFYVVSDSTRDAFGPQERAVSRYSYMMLYTSGDKTGIMLANSFKRIPISSEYVNTDFYIMLYDTQMIKDADISGMVMGMMDEDAPLKVYSPDGLKFVSYTDGRKTVNYEVYGENQYASGIILPDESDKVIALEWRDNDVVLVTYETTGASYVRIAFDVTNQTLVQLSEQESSSLDSIDTDYFTDDDMAAMEQDLINSASGFILSITDAAGSRVYSIDPQQAIATETMAGSAEPAVKNAVWSEAIWKAFLSEAMDTGVLDWHRYYDGGQGDEWSLEISGGGQKILSSGTEAYPEEFNILIGILDKYFEPQES